MQACGGAVASSALDPRVVLDDVRLYVYPPCGQIKAHTDGVLADRETGQLTTHSIIVYLNDNDSGSTEFLTSTGPDQELVAAVPPEADFPIRMPDAIYSRVPVHSASINTTSMSPRKAIITIVLEDR